MVWRYLILVLLGLLWSVQFQSCSRERSLNPKAATDRLKVLNSDIVTLLDSSAARPEIKALRFLWDQKSAPLPVRSDSARNYLKNIPYSFEANKGVYMWDTGSHRFVRVRDTSAAVLYFPMPGNTGDRCRFVLSEYTRAAIRSRPDFPVSAAAKLYINNREIMSVIYQATVEEGLFKTVEFGAVTDQYKILFHLERTGTLEQKTGTLSCVFEIRTGPTSLIRSELDGKIDYHNPGTWSFREIQIDQQAFNTQLKGTIHYGNINPTAKDYAADFNRNTDVVMTDDENQLIGKIILEHVRKTDQLDYFITYSDGTSSRLSDHIILLKKLFNLKY